MEAGGIDPKIQAQLLKGIPGYETNQGQDIQNTDGGAQGSSTNQKGETGGIVESPDVMETILKSFGLSTDEVDMNAVKEKPQVIVEKAHEKFIEKLSPMARFILENEGKEGFDIAEFANSITVKDVSKIPADEVISTYMYETYGKYDAENNPDGITDEDIKQELDKMTKIERKELERKAREFIAENKGKSLNEYASKLDALQKQQFQNIIESQKKNAERIVNGSSKVNEVFGITMTDDEKKAFNEVFPSMIIPREDTGMAPLLEMIYSLDDEGLYKLTYALWATEDKFKKYISTIKSGTKKKIMEMLNTPKSRSANGTNEKLDEVDVSKLKIPERK